MGCLGRLPLIVVLGVGCVALSASASAGTRTASAGAVVKAAFNKHLKKTILVDARGLTLYLFTADPKGTPTCHNDPTDHCSKIWPPLTTTSAPKAGPGVKASLLGTAKNRDGKLQVTYRGHPLYRNAGLTGYGLVADKKPGDVNGQGFFSLWYVLSPLGKPIH
jgi:predicted lipoprotein with Yx(FWY)xxD motif